MNGSKVLEANPALELLEVAVPLRITELRVLSDSERQELAGQAGQYIACHGDDLMFRSKKGNSAKAFSQLATGLAALAFCPGGVSFAGMHWEVS